MQLHHSYKATKIALVVVGGALAMGALYSCSASEPTKDNSHYDQPPVDKTYAISYGQSANVGTLTDTLTGCEYIVTDRGGVTPRMFRDPRTGKYTQLGCAS